jgi:hypothetical protein
MLLILEGPDGSGKSTLATILAKKYNASVTHHHAYKGYDSESLTKIFLESIVPALCSDKNNVVLDRCWISEEIYAEEFRYEKSRLSEYQSDRLNVITRLCKSALIACIPPYEVAFNNWSNPERDELVKDHKDYQAVYYRYKNSLFYRPGIPMFTYDYTKDSHDALYSQLDYLLL